LTTVKGHAHCNDEDRDEINFEKGRHSIGYRQGWELVDV